MKCERGNEMVNNFESYKKIPIRQKEGKWETRLKTVLVPLRLPKRKLLLCAHVCVGSTPLSIAHTQYTVYLQKLVLLAEAVELHINGI